MFYLPGDRDTQDSVHMRSNLFSRLTKHQEECVSGGTAGSDLASVLRNVAPNNWFITTWDAAPSLKPTVSNYHLISLSYQTKLSKETLTLLLMIF